jgi:hypothetical protein
MKPNTLSVRRALDANRLDSSTAWIVYFPGTGTVVSARATEVEARQLIRDRNWTRARASARPARDLLNDSAGQPASLQIHSTGRVVVFTRGGDEDEEISTRVFVIPGHWDGDDIDRFVNDRYDDWETAAVVTIERVPEEAL